VLAFSAIAVASASADEWLVGGNAFTGALNVETKGLLTLTVLVLGIKGVALDCEGTFDGTVTGGATGADSITALLNTAGEEISKSPLSGLALSCEVVTSVGESCGMTTELAEVWPENLPWATVIELEGATFLDGFPNNSGYEVLCPAALGSTERKSNICDENTLAAKALLTNEPTGVLGAFLEAETEVKCTEGTGHQEGEGVTVNLGGGGILSVS
jgi:hypothetical protein